MKRHTQQPLTIRDLSAEPPTALNLAEARDRELTDSVLRRLVAPLPTPGSPPGPTVAASAVQPPRFRSTTSDLTTSATPQPKGGEHVA